MEDAELYIPQIKVKSEYFPGFGRKELKNTSIMSIVVVFFSIILYLSGADIAAIMLTVMLGVIASITLNTKNDAELSMVTFVGLFIRYLREQQQFLYRYQDEWKI